MEFNTKLSKLIARRKVIETRKRLNKIIQSPFEINNTLKTVYQNNVVDNNKKYIDTPTFVLNIDTAAFYGQAFKIMEAAKRAKAKLAANIKQ